MKTPLIALLLLAPAVAPAQTIHKCVDAKGDVVYQSTHCGPGQEARQSWAVEMAPPSSSELSRRKARERANAKYLKQLAGRYGRPAAGGAAIGTSRSSDRCKAAKSRRSKAEAESHRLSIRQLERLGDAVYEACN